ncbi:MAG: hypothetical protein JW783_09020 [Bacteroidales bacterium]|nr:hypothetical protein [Bacteroidales bacterium]MBN2748088.1 hypothetical protein [Bacteroidales bacterium]
MKKKQTINEEALSEWNAMTNEETGLIIGGAIDELEDDTELEPESDANWSKAIKWKRRWCK